MEPGGNSTGGGNGGAGGTFSDPDFSIKNRQFDIFSILTGNLTGGFQQIVGATGGGSGGVGASGNSGAGGGGGGIAAIFARRIVIGKIHVDGCITANRI